MSQCESKINDDTIHIDINTTSICNLACSYCSEGNECGLSTLYLENTDVKVEDLIKRLGKDPAKHKTINFWGGEPFVNWDFCKAIIDGFKDDETYSFFFYTNGIYIPKYIEELKKYNEEFGSQRFEGNARLIIQISFDGNHLTDTIRVDKSGKGTTKRVVEAYNMLRENGIETSLKSVISSEGFQHLFSSFKDLYSLQGHYNPTPDLWSDSSPEEFEQELEVLGQELEKIAGYIYANNLDPEVFSWFRKSRAICGAGAAMVSVDLDGSMYPCHGCMYGGSDEHKLGHFDNFTEVKEKTMKFYASARKDLPLQCQECDVNFCMKCNIANYQKSEKEKYEDKWTDYQANWQVCKLFKFADKYNKTIRYAMATKGGQ